jgi:PHD/YefM family antitoxin component YafN of YafNO toxin-antitoxin module
MKRVDAWTFRATAADLNALNSRDEPIILVADGKDAAAIVSMKQLRLLQVAEERVLDQLDLKEVKESLTDPKWVPWEEVEKQLKS